MQQPDYVTTCVLGGLRGGIATCLTYPLEVIKVELQRQSHPACSNIYRTSGIRGFYAGLSPQLAKVLCKQVYSWPLITHVPRHLEGSSLPFWAIQGTAGLIHGTVDAWMMPLERLRFRLLLGKMRDQSLWKGFTVYWARLSALWSTFLISQKYYRNQEKDRNVPTQRLILIGAKTTFWASLALAPFDLAHTLTQAEKKRTITFTPLLRT